MENKTMEWKYLYRQNLEKEKWVLIFLSLLIGLLPNIYAYFLSTENKSLIILVIMKK